MSRAAAATGPPDGRGMLKTAGRARGFVALTLASALIAAAVAALTDVAAAANREGNARFAAGDAAGALERYEQARRVRPSGEVDVNAASALHALSEFARASSAYTDALGGGRADLRELTLYDQGNTMFRLRRLADARRAYEDALRIDPNDRDAKFNLEIIGRLEEQARQAAPPGGQAAGGQPSPGEARPGQGPGQPGGGQGQDPGQGPGSPGSRGSAPGLGEALDDFHDAPTLEDALGVLDALRREQHGVGGRLEQPSPYLPTKP